MISATPVPSARSTSSAVASAGEPDRLALVAVSTPAGAQPASTRASGCPGTRTATVSRPAVTPGATAPARTGTTSVSGPGQNAAASRSAVSLHRDAMPRAASVSAAMSGSASPAARPLAAKIAATASSRAGSTPRP